MSTVQPAILHQPNITVIPEEKKPSSPPPGAALYDDIFTTYCFLETIFLLNSSPIAYASGSFLGLMKGCYSYYKYGAPKKIAQDDEKNDFAVTLHQKGIIGFLGLITKKFLLGVYLPTHIKGGSNLLAGRNFTQIDTPANIIKHAFVLKKSAEFSNTCVQRLACWLDTPVK